jgi:hypothetical protein
MWLAFLNQQNQNHQNKKPIMTYTTIAELCVKCIVKMLLNWLLMHLNLNPNFLIYIWFIWQKFQGGLCSLLQRFSYISATSVPESFAHPLIIEDINVYTIGWKSLIRLSLYLISGSNYLARCCLQFMFLLPVYFHVYFFFNSSSILPNASYIL